VREAVAAAPDGGEARFVVHVKEGVYKETVSVVWEKANLVLVGDGMGKTVITGDLNADTPGISTFNTATVGAYTILLFPYLCGGIRTYTHGFGSLYCGGRRTFTR
jgi:pectin methylesterase-like acyl-CoA thioesterase